jgi:hypothetical protein
MLWQDTSQVLKRHLGEQKQMPEAALNFADLSGIDLRETLVPLGSTVHTPYWKKERN